MIRYLFSKIKIRYTTSTISENADNNIFETNIMLFTWYTATDADHKSDSNIRETSYHVLCNTSYRIYAIFPIREASYYYMVLSNLAHIIDIVIILRYIGQFMHFI